MHNTLTSLYSTIVLFSWMIPAVAQSPIPITKPSPTRNLADIALPTKPVSLGDVSACSGDSVPPVLSVTTDTGITVDWFDVASEGSILPGGNGTLRFTPPIGTENSNVAKSYFAQARDKVTGVVNPERTEVVLQVNARPSAHLTGSTTVCAGGEATLQIHLTGAAPWTLTWSDGVQQISAGPDTTRVVSPTNNSTFYLTALLDHNCTAQFSDLGESLLVRVEPKLSATITSLTTNVCTGDAVRIPVTFSGLGPWTVTWSDGSTSTAVSSPANLEVRPINAALNGSVTTNYTILHLSNGRCEAAAEDLKGKATLKVFPRPTAVVSGDATLCAGDSAILQVTLTGTGPWNVTWSDSTNQTFQTSPGRRTVKPSSSTQYQIIALKDKNCDAELAGLTGSATVQVLDRPTATLTGEATICSQSSTDLQVALTGVAPWTVTWSDGLIQSNVLQSPLVRTVFGTNNGPAQFITNRYSIKALLASDCKAIASDLQGEARVRVTSGPGAVVSGTNSVCSGDSAVLSVALTGTGPWEIAWSDGVVQTVNNARTNRVVTGLSSSSTALTTNVYTITNIADSICSSDSSRVRGRSVVLVYPPVAATLSGGGTICSGGSELLTVALQGTSPWTLTWSDGFKQTTNGPVAIRNVKPSKNTDYTLAVVTDRHCQAAESNLVGIAEIVVAEPPTALVSGNLTLCEGSTNTIQATLTGVGPWTLTWSDGLVQSNVTQSPALREVTYPVSGNTGPVTNRYSLKALSSGDCVAKKADLQGEAIVIVPPHPTVLVTSVGGTLCSGDSAVLQIQLTGTPPWNAVWSDGEVATYTSSSTNRIVRPTRLSSFSIRSLQDANCTALPSGISGNVQVRVSAAPTAPQSLGDVTQLVGSAQPPILVVESTNLNTVVDWFSDATGGVALLTGTNRFAPTNTIVGSYTYYASARNTQTGCTSTNRTAVTLKLELGVAVQTLSATSQLLSWQDDYWLQSTTNLFLPQGHLNWVNVRTGAVSQLNYYTNIGGPKELYFRLFKP